MGSVPIYYYLFLFIKVYRKGVCPYLFIYSYLFYLFNSKFNSNYNSNRNIRRYNYFHQILCTDYHSYLLHTLRQEANTHFENFPECCNRCN